MRPRYTVAVTYPLLLLSLVLGVAILLGHLGVKGTKQISEELVQRISQQTSRRMRLAVLKTLEVPGVWPR